MCPVQTADPLCKNFFYDFLWFLLKNLLSIRATYKNLSLPSEKQAKPLWAVQTYLPLLNVHKYSTSYLRTVTWQGISKQNFNFYFFTWRKPQQYITKTINYVLYFSPEKSRIKKTDIFVRILLYYAIRSTNVNYTSLSQICNIRSLLTSPTRLGSSWQYIFRSELHIFLSIHG